MWPGLGQSNKRWCNTLGLSKSNAVAWAEEKEQLRETRESHPLRAVASAVGMQPACKDSTGGSQRNTFTLLLSNLLPCLLLSTAKQKPKNKMSVRALQVVEPEKAQVRKKPGGANRKCPASVLCCFQLKWTLRRMNWKGHDYMDIRELFLVQRICMTIAWRFEEKYIRLQGSSCFWVIDEISISGK